MESRALSAAVTNVTIICFVTVHLIPKARKEILRRTKRILHHDKKEDRDFRFAGSPYLAIAVAVAEGSSILLDVQNLLAVIEAAHLADAVILYECVTCRVGALCHTGHRELAVVGASLVSAGFRYFFLWYCHVYTSSCVNIYGFTS